MDTTEKNIKMNNSTAVSTMIFYPCFVMSTTAGVFLNCCGQIIELKLLEINDANGLAKEAS